MDPVSPDPPPTIQPLQDGMEVTQVPDLGDRIHSMRRSSMAMPLLDLSNGITNRLDEMGLVRDELRIDVVDPQGHARRPRRNIEARRTLETDALLGKGCLRSRRIQSAPREFGAGDFGTTTGLVRICRPFLRPGRPSIKLRRQIFRPTLRSLKSMQRVAQCLLLSAKTLPFGTNLLIGHLSNFSGKPLRSPIQGLKRIFQGIRDLALRPR